MKRTLSRLLTISIALLTLVGVALGIVLIKSHGDFKKNADIIVSEDETIKVKDLDVSLTGFYPGKSQEYDISLVCEAEGSYKITLSFKKVGDGTLENYIDTEVSADGESKGANLLKNYFEGEEVSFNANVDSKEPLVINVKYSMPLEVGDEAQNAVTNFDLTVKIEKE